MNTKLHDKAMKAAEKYLELTGREVIGTADDYIVYEDEDEIAVGKVRITKRTMQNNVAYDYRMTRNEFEEVITQVMYDNPDVIDCRLRFDMIELFVVHDDRAIVRHHINAGFKKEEDTFIRKWYEDSYDSFPSINKD